MRDRHFPGSGNMPWRLLTAETETGRENEAGETCKAEGTSPETAYKGSLNVRFKNSDIHRRAAVYAIMHEQSLNSFIEEAVEEKLAKT